MKDAGTWLVLFAAVVAVGYWLVYLGGHLRRELQHREATNRRHTWADTFTILAALAAWIALAAYGTSGPTLLKLTVAAIVIYYVVRDRLNRRAAKKSQGFADSRSGSI